MNKNPKEFIENWIDYLVYSFKQSERDYQRPLDRGAPRENALKEKLRSFLPHKYGITSGHVVSSKPAWSKQSDLIIYNALESPVFITDNGFQGSVLPAESVYGIIEVKSSLDSTTARDAINKTAEFKRLCQNVSSPLLKDRFGAIFSYRFAVNTKEEQEALIDECIEFAKSFPEEERFDELIVLGIEEEDISESVYLTRIPFGSPTGPLQYYTRKHNRKNNLKLFLLKLDLHFRKIRTGAPLDMLSYLFDESETTTEDNSDLKAKFQYLNGEQSVSNIVQSKITPEISLAKCPMCSKNKFSYYDDIYCLVATKDFYFGHLGSPKIPVVVIQCFFCKWLSFFPSNGYDITPNY